MLLHGMQRLLNLLIVALVTEVEVFFVVLSRF